MQANRGLLFILPIAILLLAACDGSSPREIKAEARPADEFARIEKLALQSCLCKMAGRNSSGADRALKAATSSLKAAEGAETPALPVHAARTCYPELGPKACLVDLWVHEPYGDGAVCSYEQADELMAAAKAAYSAHPGDRERADAIVRKRFEALRAEAAAKIPQSACN
jgi:hypothetical protein